MTGRKNREVETRKMIQKRGWEKGKERTWSVKRKEKGRRG